MIGYLDLDLVKYSLASVGEKKSITVVNRITGERGDFKTRTDFHGRTKAKDGGWLGEYNKLHDTSFTVSDYDIEDVVEYEPIENVLHSTKLSVESIIASSKATKWFGVIGKKESMRLDRSTLLEYKGNRPSKPYYLDQVVEYLEKKYKPILVNNVEADDFLVMATTGKKDHFVIAVDKDMYGTPIQVFNPSRPEEGIVNCYGFGKLWIDSSGKTKKYRGVGRLFKYFQISSSDAIDHYAANCFSDVRWGQQHAFDSLVNCKDDKEAFTEMVKIFKYLYPTPKTVTGWRGNDIEIDWLYVMQEMTDMAHIHRKENDWLNVRDILNNLGVEY